MIQDLSSALEEIRAAMATGEPTDATLGTYYVVLRGIDGELIDKQPLSRLMTMMYNYLAEDKAKDIKLLINQRQQ